MSVPSVLGFGNGEKSVLNNLFFTAIHPLFSSTVSLASLAVSHTPCVTFTTGPSITFTYTHTHIIRPGLSPRSVCPLAQPINNVMLLDDGRTLRMWKMAKAENFLILYKNAIFSVNKFFFFFFRLSFCCDVLAYRKKKLKTNIYCNCCSIHPPKKKRSSDDAEEKEEPWRSGRWRWRLKETRKCFRIRRKAFSWKCNQFLAMPDYTCECTKHFQLLPLPTELSDDDVGKKCTSNINWHILSLFLSHYVMCRFVQRSIDDVDLIDSLLLHPHLHYFAPCELSSSSFVLLLLFSVWNASFLLIGDDCSVREEADATEWTGQESPSWLHLMWLNNRLDACFGWTEVVRLLVFLLLPLPSSNC